MSATRKKPGFGGAVQKLRTAARHLSYIAGPISDPEWFHESSERHGGYHALHPH
jgi:hypothetical protein